MAVALSARRCLRPWLLFLGFRTLPLAHECLRRAVPAQGFLGPETENDKFVPGISTVRYHRNDMTIEVVHVVGHMGEVYVETRCRREADENGQGDLTHLGHNTTHTGYQLRRALDLQAEAICSRLGVT